MSKLVDEIYGYFDTKLYKPLFVSVDDGSYKETIDALAVGNDIEFVRLSSCCYSEDKKPDFDKLREIMRMADVYCNSNKIVILGVGEYLALEGSHRATEILNELIAFNLGSAHAVFLLRGLNNQLLEMCKNDPRLEGRQIILSDNKETNISFIFSSIELNLYEVNGFKKALEFVENGDAENIEVNTSTEFPMSLLPIRIIKDSYEAIRKRYKPFSFNRDVGNEEYWAELFKELSCNGSIDNVYKDHRFDDNNDNELYNKINGEDYVHWLYYTYLLSKRDSIKNAYVEYVINSTDSFSDFKDSIVDAILKVPHSDSAFNLLYEERKKVMKGYPDADVAAFIVKNRMDPEESIYRLTDNTLLERKEIISEVSKRGIPNSLEYIYPDLYWYLKDYYFNGDAIRDLLSEYFINYKKQKIGNEITNEFLKEVDELARSRAYNRLRTRDELVTAIDRESTFLCWIDALGVEYLSYIVSLAQQNGLAISVDVGRVNLPSITSINKQFYENWPSDYKYKERELDEIKHKEKGGYYFDEDNPYPIHLAQELDVIKRIINGAASELALRKYDKYVIASDHGASRLAVLRRKEEKYETDTRGEHSGRCCKAFADYDLPFATEENGYIVLADYGRFKGSRAANVEVHGGASLEEVVVPVITLSLKDNSIAVNMVEDFVKADYKTGISITLYVNKQINSKLYVSYKGKKYIGERIDSNHYSVNIPEIKRACIEPAGIYIGEDLVAHIDIKAVGKSASMNSDFDDLF